MMPAFDNAYFVMGLLTAGTGAVYFWADRANTIGRPLALSLVLIGLRLFMDAFGLDESDNPLFPLVATSLESVSILAGIEWGLRIGKTAKVALARAAIGLFRAAQILVLVYWLMSMGYVHFFPELATADSPGFFKVRSIEWAIFAPLLGTSMLCGAIAIGLLLRSRIDKAEAIRLRALFVAAPFLISGLVVSDLYIPVTIAIGLLIYLSGTLHYLVIQGQRGHFMSQFLSPEVARVVRSEGLSKVLQRERRPLSVVLCDLRGFTAYAREHDSGKVVNLLERYYNVVGEVASEYGGTIKDHAGDGVLILVGAPLPLKDHARRAALMSLEIMRRVPPVLSEAGANLGLGIGVATGKATVGAIRGAGRLEYVAVGTPVNLAARLCSRAAGGEILADDRTQAALRPDDAVVVSAREPEQLKGFPEPVPVYSLATPSEAAEPRREEAPPWWQWLLGGATSRRHKPRRRKRS
ncbi:MAG TPA: adenylate/guanylate cyclase domain-containing protein [Nevskiales bacterium]|nr:adenylate/guanylate cyclase domain-containing protein [Nevskiales bacterium]